VKDIRENCIKDHNNYSGEKLATVYTRSPESKAEIKKIDQMIFPKYELGDKI
jgi:hypothetical protein